MKHIRTLLAVLAAATVPTAGLVATAAPTIGPVTAAGCATGWGSLPEASNRTTTAQLTGIRSGRHACFDRLVVDLNGRPAGYRVEYVATVRQDGSGFAVPLRGGAKLQVVVRAPDHDLSYRPTYRPANRRELVDVGGYRTFRQVAWAGSFEGQSTVGVGVRGRLPFRVLTLTGPGTGSRLVIDVAHTW
ncbi:MAG: AMIN-like domain-containing (lipo)protein [Kribbellaceae bacterium]|nr:hypothetical protein [Kribbellaceae bacterium]